MTAGVLKIRCVRLFPAVPINEILGRAELVGVMDRSLSFGLGGRDLSLDQIELMFRSLSEIQSTGQIESAVRYFGLRE